jgi:uncharacterized protein YbjT (DUF2867 family)
MIAVMGTTGNTGKAIAEEALRRGEKVRVLGRSAERLAKLKSLGAEVAPGDGNDVGYLARAFSGADAVYTLIPPNPQAPDFRAYQDRLGEATVRAIRESGVRRAVFLSSVGADLPSGTGPIAGLHAQEERLKAVFGLNLLVLRPGYFFENHLATLGMIKQQGVNGGALAPELRFPQIATRDIAAAAAQALVARDFTGASMRELLGPRDLSMSEATRILGERIGKPDLKYVQFGYADFESALAQMGLSKSVAGLYAEMARAFNEGRIKLVQGRRPETTTPTTFESFAELLAAAYKG